MCVLYRSNTWDINFQQDKFKNHWRTSLSFKEFTSVVQPYPNRETDSQCSILYLWWQAESWLHTRDVSEEGWLEATRSRQTMTIHDKHGAFSVLMTSLGVAVAKGTVWKQFGQIFAWQRPHGSVTALKSHTQCTHTPLSIPAESFHLISATHDTQHLRLFWNRLCS